MSECTIDTLLKLLVKYYVEIPIIQRDYAQGRQDDHTKMVRDNLLADMKSAILRETKPLDLNFVYGKAEGGKFIPIDGQQRLTTLFLLHLYAFCNDSSKTKLLRNFNYETRTSSRDFLEKLIENRATVFSSSLIPSKEIEDSEWFVSDWKYDPTIQSVFIMLDNIREAFEDVENLDQILTNQKFEPIVFKFLDIDDLGMEDSLYIKLNERGKPLTSFENFKARLIGRLQKLQSTFTDDFEQNFDREWTDLFWSKSWKNFDQTYLAFFAGLLMNAGFFENEANWSNTLGYDEIGEDIFETAFYTLNFLCQNPNNNEVHQLVFNALKEKRTYQDRVLFHAVTTYLFQSKGIDMGSLRQWLRIIHNLTLNSQIDQPTLYRRAINGINSFSENWDDLIKYFSQNGNVTGFSQEQIEEERIKAQLVLQSEDFAEEIYKAEQHPYFSGQVRSALWYAKDGVGKYDKDSFVRYWDKISSLFERAKPKHGHLLRQALLTYGDFTISVGEYKTLCVDDPNEAASTPSLKRLFSNHGIIVKYLLDTLNTNNDIRSQLEDIVNNATLPKADWRYCFVKFPDLFKEMSVSHLRLRKVGDNLLVIPNKSSNGYNCEVFSVALQIALKQRGIRSVLVSELGTWANRYLESKEHKVRFTKGKFIIDDATETVVLETKTDDPIAEVTHHLLKL